jgi:hypothetical protein
MSKRSSSELNNVDLVQAKKHKEEEPQEQPSPEPTQEEEKRGLCLQVAHQGDSSLIPFPRQLVDATLVSLTFTTNADAEGYFILNRITGELKHPGVQPDFDETRPGGALLARTPTRVQRHRPKKYTEVSKF